MLWQIAQIGFTLKQVPVLILLLAVEILLGGFLLWVGYRYLAKVSKVKLPGALLAWTGAVVCVVVFDLIVLYVFTAMTKQGLRLPAYFISSARMALVVLNLLMMWLFLRFIVKVHMLKTIVAWIPTLGSKIVTVPLLIAMITTDASQKADASAMATDVRMVQVALERFRFDVARYPTNEEGLRALVEAPAGIPWDGPYLDEQPRDQWGQPLRYQIGPGLYSGRGTRPYRILSDGPDGRPETSDDIVLTP